MRVYLYPSAKDQSNPYVRLLSRGISNDPRVTKLITPSNFGLFDFRILRSDLIVLNWIENISSRKFGILQGFYALLIFPLLKLLFGKRIVYINHNNFHRNNDFLSIRVFSLMRYYLSFTHTKEIADITGAHYYPHPLYSVKSINYEAPKEFDIMIWGQYADYKGINEFVNWHISSSSKLRVLLLTSICNLDVRSKVLESIYFDYYEGYTDDVQLEKYLTRSKCVLFNYLKAGSSGAVMWTLGYAWPILGRMVGEFEELHEKCLIRGYHDLDEIERLIEDLSPPTEAWQEFQKEYSWEGFATQMITKAYADH